MADDADPVWVGGVELGGTKVICLVGSGPEHLVAQTRIPTAAPGPTLARVVDFLRGTVAAGGSLSAIGIASFGPLELRRTHPRYGFVRSSPKPGWTCVDVAAPIRSGLGVPVGIDTDVNGAALGEGRWGAGRGLSDFVYLTVGTGIGAAAVIDGRLVHGLVHPEMGHVGVARRPGDDFPGVCPYHGDCLEGMASGVAMAARWGRPAEQLDGDELTAAVQCEAAYLADGLRTIVYTSAPQRIVIGGGLAALPGLFPLLRTRLAESLGGYPGLPEHTTAGFVVPAALGALAGPAGALVLAADALNRSVPERDGDDSG